MPRRPPTSPLFPYTTLFRSPPAIAVAFGPRRPAHPFPVRNPVRLAAQRHYRPVSEGRCLRQATEAGRNPGAMLLGKVARVLERAAGRNREHDFARRRLNTQGVTSRLTVPTDADRKDRAVESDLDPRRLARAAKKQRMRHRRTPNPIAERYCHSAEIGGEI